VTVPSLKFVGGIRRGTIEKARYDEMVMSLSDLKILRRVSEAEHGPEAPFSERVCHRITAFGRDVPDRRSDVEYKNKAGWHEQKLHPAV